MMNRLAIVTVRTLASEVVDLCRAAEKADAWDEGHRTGRVVTTNPYRKTQQ